MQRLLTPFRLALLIGLLLSALRFSGCGYLGLLDARGFDFRLLQRGVQPASPQVVIVAVDNASIAKIGRWPWPRPVMAELLHRLSAAGPAVIGFDVVQSERTQTPDIAGERQRFAAIDDRTWAALRHALSGTAQDAALAHAIAASGRAVLGYFFDFHARADTAPPVAVSTYNVVQSSPGGRGEAQVPHANAATGNLPRMTAAASAVGYFNVFPDADGSFRRVPLVLRYRGQMALPLSLAMLRVYRPHVPLLIRLRAFGVETVRFGDEDIPVAEDGQMLVNYRGPGRTFRYVPAVDVLAGRVAPESLRGKLLLVGVTATAVADVRVTPFDSVFPGVEIHANVLDNILRHDFIAQPRWLVLADVAVILALVTLLSLALHYARGVRGAVVALALVGGYLAGSQWVFRAQRVPLSLVYPLLAIGFTYVTVSVQHYVVEAREKRKIRDAFSLYLTPSLARLVSERPEMLTLGGDTRELTVLFSDVRGFTTISEQFQHEPQRLVELLNEFLGGMTDVIFGHDGTLDKYVGDEIMAVWGAPIPQADHAARACRAALDMLPRLDVLNQQWQQRGWPALHIGIGLNTGPMVVGNMGSARRLSYTVVGDNVNLGARLEGLSKYYGSNIIASEATVRAAGAAVVARELDLVRVKGKRLPVRVFEILGPGSEEAQWDGLLRRFAAGVAAYRERRWQEAQTAFSAVLATRPDDSASRLYVRRCVELATAPPGPEWDGVTTMEVK
jgi:adenylate cyclase